MTAHSEHDLQLDLHAGQHGLGLPVGREEAEQHQLEQCRELGRPRASLAQLRARAVPPMFGTRVNKVNKRVYKRAGL